VPNPPSGRGSAAPSFSELMKERRTNIGKVALLTGIDAERLRNYERGGQIAPEDLPKLAKVLGLAPNPDPPTTNTAPSTKTQLAQPAHPAPTPTPVAKAKPTAPAVTTPPAVVPVTPSQPSPIVEPATLLPAAILPVAEPAPVQASEPESVSKVGEQQSADDIVPSSEPLAPATQAEAQSSQPMSKRRFARWIPADDAEMRYLSICRKDKAMVRFTLFNGEVITGRVAGFNTYTIVVREDNSDERVLQKMGLLHYQRLRGEPQLPDQSTDQPPASEEVIHESG